MHAITQILLRRWANSGRSLPEKGGPSNVQELLDEFCDKHSFRGAGRLRKLLTKLFMPAANGPTLVRTRYGFDIIVNPVVDKGLERFIYAYGTFEAGTLYAIEKCLRRNDTFFDIGSNIGLMSLLASQVIGEHGTVYAFEPEPAVFSSLRQNIEINRVRNVRAFPIALGSARTTETIYSNLDKSRGSASLIRPHEDLTEGIEVQVDTLDEFTIRENISDTRMMKIDVEGWELEVLQGAKRLLSSCSAPIICIEYSKFHQSHKGQALDLYNHILAVNEYKIYKLDRGKEIGSRLVRIRNVTDLPDHDNLFCFLPAHLEELENDMFA